MKKTYQVLVVPIVSLCLGILVASTLLISNIFVSHKVSKADPIAYSEIQQRLKDWGYYSGPITGTIGPLTTEAIKFFQREHDITETGNLDAQTLSALGVYVSTQTMNDLYLLAKCVHAEARGEPYEGQVAVAAVILNRVRHPEFPNTIYGVIYQPWAFTAVHDGQINLEPDESSYQAAQDALSGWDPSYGSIFYYNPKVATSQWIFTRETVTVIGRHIFAI